MCYTACGLIKPHALKPYNGQTLRSSKPNREQSLGVPIYRDWAWPSSTLTCSSKQQRGQYCLSILPFWQKKQSLDRKPEPERSSKEWVPLKGETEIQAGNSIWPHLSFCTIKNFSTETIATKLEIKPNIKHFISLFDLLIEILCY